MFHRLSVEDAFQLSYKSISFKSIYTWNSFRPLKRHFIRKTKSYKPCLMFSYNFSTKSNNF